MTEYEIECKTYYERNNSTCILHLLLDGCHGDLIISPCYWDCFRRFLVKRSQQQGLNKHSLLDAPSSPSTMKLPGDDRWEYCHGPKKSSWLSTHHWYQRYKYCISMYLYWFFKFNFFKAHSLRSHLPFVAERSPSKRLKRSKRTWRLFEECFTIQGMNQQDLYGCFRK